MPLKAVSRPEEPAARPQERRHLRDRLIIVVSRPWLSRKHRCRMASTRCPARLISSALSARRRQTAQSPIICENWIR